MGYMARLSEEYGRAVRRWAGVSVSSCGRVPGCIGVEFPLRIPFQDRLFSTTVEGMGKDEHNKTQTSNDEKRRWASTERKKKRTASRSELAVLMKQEGAESCSRGPGKNIAGQGK